METNEAGLSLIKYWERNPKTGTFYDKAYQDDEGVWTIGWGTIRWDPKTPVKEGDTITAEEADRQLKKEVQRVDDAIDQSVTVPLNENEHAALSVWGYNVGIGWITGKGHQQATLIKLLNKGNYAAVPTELLKFTHGAVSGQAYSGLLARRKQEAQLWLKTAEDPHPVVATDVPTPKPLPQAVAPAQTASTGQAVANSPTVGMVAVSLPGAIYIWWQHVSDFLFGVVKEAGPQLIQTQQDLSPFSAVFKMTPAVLATLTVGTLLAVAARQIYKRRNGTSV